MSIRNTVAPGRPRFVSTRENPALLHLDKLTLGAVYSSVALGTVESLLFSMLAFSWYSPILAVPAVEGRVLREVVAVKLERLVYKTVLSDISLNTSEGNSVKDVTEV